MVYYYLGRHADSIVIENLTKYYGKFLALDNLSLRVPEKENIGLLGPNGAGKSTTLKILCGLIQPTSGKAYIDGIDVVAQPEKALSRIGAIIETPEFYSYLTPVDTLNYFGQLRGMKGETLKKRIKEVIELVNLEKWSKDKDREIFPRHETAPGPGANPAARPAGA